MGVAALNEYGQLKNSIVLRKDTHIPCKVSDIFNTVVDNQTELHVQVTEGEDIELEYVAIVGETTMKIPPYPKGAPIEVFFEYDPNGIIHVTVFDLTANKSLGEMHIERKSNLKDDEVEAMKQKLSKKPIN
jgi:molecular chaperone DnaK